MSTIQELFVSIVGTDPVNQGLAGGFVIAEGGMLYVISDEIISETHANGNERIATLGTMAGLIVMLYFDVALAA